VFTTPTDATVNGTQGKTVTFAAEARLSGAAYFKKDVTWSVSGNTKTGTTISTAGVLTIAGDEPVGTSLTVTATSVADTNKKATKTVKVVAKGVDVTNNIVTLNDTQFYVLYRDTANNKALLLSKDILMQKRMDPTDTTHYPVSELRNYLNNEWLNSMSQVKEFAVETKIKVRENWNSDAFEEDTCKVFLLSQADVYGTRYNAQSKDVTASSDDYTVPEKGKLEIPGNSWVANYNNSAAWWWLRSPRYSSGSAADVGSGGNLDDGRRVITSGGVRPAFWVKTS